MSFINTRGRFHVALDGVGLLLQGAPDRPGYIQSQAPIYGNRFASGDRDYNDLSQWWYFVQTDWSGGFKDTVSWANDAKYYLSTNIDAWSENGAIKLTREQYPSGAGGDNDFTYEIICGTVGDLNGMIKKFVGLGDGADSRPHIYSADPGEDQAWTDISTTTIGTNQNIIAQMSCRLGILWVSTVGIGMTWKVITYDGSTWTDQSAYIDSYLTYQGMSSRCHVEYAGTMYMFVDNGWDNQYACCKTTQVNPSAAGHWSLVFEVTKTAGLPISAAAYNGNIYYLVNQIYYAELWAWNIVASSRTLVQRFNSGNLNNWSIGDKLMVILNGKLIITIPNKEIWEMDGSTLTQIYKIEESKYNDGHPEVTPYLYYGAVISDNKAWWGNLMYDGTHFYNLWKNDADSTSNRPFPLFADTSNRIWESHSGDDSVCWSVNITTGGFYKGDADKNFLVFSNFDNVAGVDKLAYSCTILFKPLTPGQSIKIEYFLGEWSTSASWTALGTTSYSIDGGTVRDKTFFFGVNVVFKKIWFRVKLESSGLNTPTMNDLVMEYLPMPTYKKLWQLRINCGDEVKDLAGSLVETTGRELRARLEVAWWTKALLDWQDFDYATTTLNGSLTNIATTITVYDTKDFPEQGRLKIDDEEIFYTNKTPTTFTGCTRGARGSRAVFHNSAAVVNNAYKVIVTDLEAEVPIHLEDKQLEYVTTVTLREA